MFTSAKTAVTVFATIALAHVAIFGTAAASMQATADHAMVRIVKAEPIIVRANSIQIVKAERIEIRAHRAV